MTMARAPFTPKELDQPIGDAMHDPALRTRVLQYVAETHGISTAAARTLIERRIRTELNSDTTLGQALEHMDHPNFTTTLDTDLFAVFNDSKALHRLVRAIAMDQDINYAQALEQLHAAADSAYESGKRRLGDVLGKSRSKPEDVQANVKLLERRDAAVKATQQRALQPMMLEHTNGQGLVLLDQGDAARATTDIGKALADPEERERRLARARKAAPGAYNGDKGRSDLLEMDKLHLEAGVDIVRTFERGHEIQAAQNETAAVARQLDQAIAGAADQRQQVRLLDAEIEKLAGQRASLRNDVAARETKLRLLEAPSGSTASADRGDEQPKTLSTTLQMRLIEAQQARPDESFEAARLRIIAEAEPGVPITLDQEFDEERAAAQPEPAPAPARALTEDQAMNLRVRERMRELGRPDSDYPRTLEELLAEER